MSEWIKCSDRLPETDEDTDTTFIVAVRRAHDGKTYVFTAEWLNEKMLHKEDPDPDDPEDGTPFSGWHSLETHADFEQYWEPLVSPCSGDEVTHWQPMPEAPGVEP
ncbi:hypothetical protein RK21_02316 [Pseudomonas plecoglossicida]|uniref:DUF551 domain-containing protein n=1 Tax=Pseudomonas plecoglossicida TaxID=70775 RepID=UPI0005A035E0|nr:DUF551 domain-containing protein [Pseudomonas plecoglossicida]AJG13824.1 hypothetical protein RK21_02316 [Pseudomonas plecoglossicida]